MMHRFRGFIIPVVMAMLGFGLGWIMQPDASPPVVQLKSIAVEPSLIDGGTKTRLRVTTSFDNSGCTQTLLTRFLLNTRPAPSIALPQQKGPSVLPSDQDVIVDDVVLDFPLKEGTWHMYSVASCFINGDPLPATAIAPIALFEVNE